MGASKSSTVTTVAAAAAVAIAAFAAVVALAALHALQQFEHLLVGIVQQPLLFRFAYILFCKINILI